MIDQNAEFINESLPEQVFYVCNMCGSKITYHPGIIRCSTLNCQSSNFKKHFSEELYRCF